MSGFDPNVEPDTQEQADTYARWCADNFLRVLLKEPHTFRTAVRASSWLLVCAAAQFHLDDDYEPNREALLRQLASYSHIARALERQRQHFVIERLIILRSSLDCWEPAGRFAEQLLVAAKSAVTAMILIEVYPLVDLWDVECHDVWALLDFGYVNLGLIEPESVADLAVRPDDDVIAKFTWQKLNNLTRHLGGPPMRPN